MYCVYSTAFLNLMMWSMTLMIMGLSVLLAAIVIQYGLQSKELPSPLSVMSENYIKSVSWGTYRPGLYFGLRTRSFPAHISTGFLWTVLQDNKQITLRHQCRQEDRLKKYGWIKHSGRNFGKQEIQDQQFNTQLTTYYLKRRENWVARIDSRELNQDKIHESPLYLFFYIDLGCYDDTLSHPCRTDLPSFNVKASDHAIHVYGIFQEKKFQIDIQVNKGSRIRYFGRKNLNIMNVQDVLQGQLQKQPELDNSIQVNSTLVLIQAIVPLYSGQLNIAYNNENMITDEEIHDASESFDDKFNTVFQLKEKGFNDSMIRFAQSAMSNLIGGIGYFYGASKIATQNSKPGALFSAVPSRSFFPRGFLWDEGFHQLLVSRWDRDMSKDIIAHWVNRMERNGWIPREQILGAESENRVPNEFLMQHPDHANPPTLLLALEQLLIPQRTEDEEYWKVLFPHLQRWYDWFKTSQYGNEPGTFRWRGRNTNDGKLVANTLASGLDDFPRASQPSDSEIHVDLLCWMIKASRILKRIAATIELPTDVFEKDDERWTTTLEEKHFDLKTKRYFDLGMHSSDGIIDEQVIIRCTNDKGGNIDIPHPVEPLRQGKPTCPDEFPKYLYPLGDGAGGLMIKPVYVPKTLKYQFVRHLGYLSLFPFLLQLIQPDSDNLKHILDDLTNPKHLWSGYGIRSMSTKAQFYEIGNAPGDNPYWRGAIWLNINYLTVAALHHYGNQPGPYQAKCKDYYSKLRTNLIDNLYREYTKTGYLWEQYNGKTGKGQRCHPFTGWSALIVNIMAEVYS